MALVVEAELDLDVLFSWNVRILEDACGGGVSKAGNFLALQRFYL